MNIKVELNSRLPIVHKLLQSNFKKLEEGQSKSRRHMLHGTPDLHNSCTGSLTSSIAWFTFSGSVVHSDELLLSKVSLALEGEGGMVVEGVGGMPIAESTTQEVLKYATLCPCLGGG